MKNPAQLLDESCQGRRAATDDFMLILRDQLHEIARRHLGREYAGHTLQPSALINEAYLRLIGQTQTDWKNSRHFRAVASNLMRRVLVDHARAKAADKRGGERQRVCLTAAGANAGDDPVELILVNDLLERLGELNPRQARMVELRIFGGLTLVEIAETLEVSLATVKNDWRFAKAWLSSQMDS